MPRPLLALLTSAFILGAVPARAEDEPTTGAGSVYIQGVGISMGAADGKPQAHYTQDSTAPGADGGAGACPTGAATAPVDATPGWLGDLAFDSGNNRWLVVSHAGKIHGRIMGNDGRPFTPVFTVNAPELSENWAPLAAYSPDAGKFLVVWADYSRGNGLYGRFVTPAGGLEKQFAISYGEVGGTPMLNMGGDRTSALRYDAANKRFVFVWHHRDPGDLVADDHRPGRKTRAAEGRHGGEQGAGPGRAVNADRRETAAYDQRNAGKWAVNRVEAATLASGQESVADIVTTNMDISYNPSTKKYLLIYDAGYAVGVKGRMLNSCSAKDGGADFLMLPNGGYAAAAANPKSGTFAAIGQNWQDYGNSYGVVSAAGQTAGKGTLFATGSKNGNFLPVIRANTTDGTFAATSSRDYAMTRFVARIGCGGGTAGKELLAWTAPENNGTGSGTVALSGTADAAIRRVEILVNLQKVGDADLPRAILALDTSAYEGGINLGAAFDAAGKSSRYTIRFNVARRSGAGRSGPRPGP
jgi:hypothetical protein